VLAAHRLQVQASARSVVDPYLVTPVVPELVSRTL
jgi:hypothetical protein